MQAAIEYAERLAYSGLIPDVYQGKPANILWAMEYGRTLGLSTLAAITGVNVIKGKPTASAGLIGALVRRAGHQLRSGYDAATMTGWAEIVRYDDSDFTFRSEWDLSRAVEAELCQVRDGRPFAVDSKGNSLPWKKFFPSMVKARATSEVARDACEEVLFGLHYTPEELGAVVDEDGAPLPEVTVEQAAERMRRNVPQDDDAWTGDPSEPTGDPKPATVRQCQKVSALAHQKWGNDLERDDRLSRLSKMIGRTLGTTKALTFGEAHRLIDALEKMPDHVGDIDDAEVVDEPTEPTPPAPNPRNGGGEPLGEESFVQSLGTLVSLAADGGPPVYDQLYEAIMDAADPKVLELLHEVATQAQGAGHLDADQFRELDQLGQSANQDMMRAARARRDPSWSSRAMAGMEQRAEQTTGAAA
jgi:hypothetical protein